MEGSISSSSPKAVAGVGQGKKILPLLVRHGLQLGLLTLHLGFIESHDSLKFLLGRQRLGGSKTHFGDLVIHGRLAVLAGAQSSLNALVKTSEPINYSGIKDMWTIGLVEHRGSGRVNKDIVRAFDDPLIAVDPGLPQFGPKTMGACCCCAGDTGIYGFVFGEQCPRGNVGAVTPVEQIMLYVHPIEHIRM